MRINLVFYIICFFNHVTFFYYAKIFIIKFTVAHNKIPARVGSKAARRVHFMLAVSFFTVRSVVEHGQWKSVKITKHIAVVSVQPFETKRVFKFCKLSKSVIVPLAV